MKKIFLAFSVFLTLSLGLSLTAQAEHASYDHTNAWEFGLGAGTHHPFAGSTFEDNNSTGDGHNYWVGYGLSKHIGVELAYDYLDFDQSRAINKFYTLSGVYRFLPEEIVYPFAKAGLSATQFSIDNEAKKNSFGAKGTIGLQSDFKYISVGGMLNYFYSAKSDTAQDLKNVQSFQPAVFIALHFPWATEGCGCTPEEHAKEHGEVKTTVVDSDHDGVPDADDKCPNTPAGTKVNAYGCAVNEVANIKLDVEFVPGSAKLEANESKEIKDFAEFMKKHANTKVVIKGFTDNTGVAAKNKKLSLRRAEAVKMELTKLGVAADRLTAEGLGQENPLADNTTAEGRKQNRRVTADISTK